MSFPSTSGSAETAWNRGYIHYLNQTVPDGTVLLRPVTGNLPVLSVL